MIPGGNNLRYTLAELEAVATIRPVSTNGGCGRRMGCPFHGSEHQRSLDVNLVTGRFSCYNCASWGYLSDRSSRRSRTSKDGPAPYGSNSRTGINKSLHEEAHKPPRMPEMVPHQKPSSPKLEQYLEAARRHLEDPLSTVYLEARKVPLALAKALGLGCFPPGTWRAKERSRRATTTGKWGRIDFPLETPGGELVGIYSRAVDPQYPGKKAPKEVRHDIWGKRGIFNPRAFSGPALYLTEGCFDALAMLAAGYTTSAALVGTKGLRWEWLSKIQELYLCGDMDAEGMKAAWSQGGEAILYGVRVYVPGPEAYGGHQEPAEQWEKEGRVTLGL